MGQHLFRDKVIVSWRVFVSESEGCLAGDELRLQKKPRGCVFRLACVYGSKGLTIHGHKEDLLWSNLQKQVIDIVENRKKDLVLRQSKVRIGIIR